jgi:hypothetical protein
VSDPILVLAWLVLAHFVADFVLQNDWIAGTKARSDSRAWLGLVVHSAIVALCLVPVVIAYGTAGLTFLVVVTVMHFLVDRWKVGATRRAEARALAAAHRRRDDGRQKDGPGAGLGSAWTPVPAIHYVLDQALHLLVSAVAWAVLLSGAVLQAPFVTAVDRVLGGWDRTVVHDVTLTIVVLGSLLIANTKGAFFLVATLVHPRELVEGTPEPSEPVPAPPPTPVGYRVRLGPVVATVEPSTGRPIGNAVTNGDEGPLALSSAPRPMTPPARVGATIGVLERLLIVTFVLIGAEAAIGFVIAAKTLARFKQLDDRGFAEYYLLGTLASVGVALGTGLLAVAALDTIR